MKKLFAFVTALTCLFSLLVMPAAAEEPDILDKKFQQTLDALDYGYEVYGCLAAYIIVKSNYTVFGDIYEDPWNHMEDRLIFRAKDYEEVISRNFVPSAEDMEYIRTVGYGDILVYDAELDEYTAMYPGGFGGSLSKRAYLGYKATSEGFDVFYGNANYRFLSDVLPEGTDEQTYAESLGSPEFLEYEGKQYANGPDGYYYLESVERVGMKYSVEYDGENVRISGAQTFTEEECPESFEKLPEVDEDLLSIMGDIGELVNKYGPEIPDEVKNGTQKGTTCRYTPDAGSYYVAIGDDTSADKDGYVKILADGMSISFKNLSKKGMLLDQVDAEFLNDNSDEIKKADLISVGFSANGFAAVAVEEVLKDKSEENSYMQWSRYLPEEGVQEIKAVLERLDKYLEENGMNETILGIPISDAIVVAAESMAYGTLVYANELPVVIDGIRAINPDAQIVVVGMDNPMENASVALNDGKKLELGVYIDQLLGNMDDVSQTVAIEKSNTVFVSAPDARNGNDNKELTATDLILSYINNIKPQAMPDAEGHAYIRNQIMRAMRKKGDANCDGRVNYKDALLVLRASINLETLSQEDMLFAEADGKEGLNYKDALKILRASIGLETLE